MKFLTVLFQKGNSDERLLSKQTTQPSVTKSLSSVALPSVFILSIFKLSWFNYEEWRSHYILHIPKVVNTNSFVAPRDSLTSLSSPLDKCWQSPSGIAYCIYVNVYVFNFISCIYIYKYNVSKKETRHMYQLYG